MLSSVCAVASAKWRRPLASAGLKATGPLAPWAPTKVSFASTQVCEAVSYVNSSQASAAVQTAAQVSSEMLVLVLRALKLTP